MRSEEMAQVHNVKLADFAQMTGRTTADAFAEKYKVPFFVVERHESYADSKEYHTLSPDIDNSRHTTEVSQPIQALPGVSFVYTVEKSGRNSFGNMITLGRSLNNDIVIPHLAVSKLHGILKYDREKAAYTFTDVGSTNGTSIASMKLEPNKPVQINSKDTLLLGGTVRTTFLGPRDFFEYMGVAGRKAQS